MSNQSGSERSIKSEKYINFFVLVKDTFLEFFAEKSMFHGAALAYYTMLAMVPLLYLCIVYVGRFLGQDMVLDFVEDILLNKVGVSDVTGIIDFLKELNFSRNNLFFEVVGIVTLLLTSSAVVVCLRQSINDFFDIDVAYTSRKKKVVRNVLFRLFSLFIVAVLTVLMILFYFGQTLLFSTLQELFDNQNYLNQLLIKTVQHMLTISSNLIVFVVVFKFVHDGAVTWKQSFWGAVITAILLYVGQLLIHFYLTNFFFGSKSGGLAGTMFILLAWVYYSSQIIFFGAKLISVHAKKTGKPIRFKE